MNNDVTASPNAAGRIIFISIALCIAYAILRYHIVRPVSWNERAR